MPPRVDLNRYAIWPALQQALPRDALDRIAGWDWGLHEDEYLTALYRLFDNGLIPTPFIWMPREVLDLLSYQDYRAAPEQAVPVLFATVVLLAAHGAPENRVRGPMLPDLVIQGIDVAHQLGGAWPSLLLAVIDDLSPGFESDATTDSFLALSLGGLLLAGYTGRPESDKQARRETILLYVADGWYEGRFGDGPWAFLGQGVLAALWRQHLEGCAEEVDELDIELPALEC